jgi:hypothetical protein
MKNLAFIILVFSAFAVFDDASPQFSCQALPNAPSTSGRYEDVFFINADYGWIVHLAGLIFKTEVKPAGSYEAIFDASRLASGLYFYCLQTGEVKITNKMLVAK